MNAPNEMSSQYKNVQIQTADRGNILIALYDGLFRFLIVAKHGLTNKKRGQAGEALSRAHAIISELCSTLDRSKFPELCENLTRLYQFSMARLTHANIHNDPAPIDEVMRVLTPIRDAFTQAVRAPSKEPHAKR
jgi:flagellar secretion chaperone FliS